MVQGRESAVASAAVRELRGADMATRDLKELKPLHLVSEAASVGPLLNDAGKRRDGRALNEFRTLFMRTGAISKAAGSAYLELGNTKVLCSVFAAHQHGADEWMQHGKLECSLRFTSFTQSARRQSSASTSSQERELSEAMAAALSASVQLDRYPKSTLPVHVLVIEDDGGALAAAITCASLALADASVLQYDLVAACTTAYLPGGALALDCTASELASSTGSMLVALMPSLNQLTLLRHNGATPFAHSVTGLQETLTGATTLHEQMQRVLLERAAATGISGAGAAASTAE